MSIGTTLVVYPPSSSQLPRSHLASRKAVESLYEEAAKADQDHSVRTVPYGSFAIRQRSTAPIEHKRGALGSFAHLLRTCHQFMNKREFDTNYIPEYLNRLLLGALTKVKEVRLSSRKKSIKKRKNR